MYRATRCKEALTADSPHPDVVPPLCSNDDGVSFNRQMSHGRHGTLDGFITHSPADNVVTVAFTCSRTYTPTCK